ncbi:hypothetical protein GCM10011332_29550 [Terasakiella brassicae]|uniref:Uncharacterized protein n=1 Tax=Terasakiella brassicae TaxID=1634917 RepID=A0A917FGG6_9PROT|nr:hypothetical protein [Terasakiella brassicae]GGF73587.1 hypothetical protein GCM10011332_29550 [Terasakiella brassicae]
MTLQLKQTKKYDPSWIAFTITGREWDDMRIYNALEDFCEDEFYMNQNRVMLQANDAERIGDQKKVVFGGGKYILHRFENQNVLKDLAAIMSKKFPEFKVSYEDNFYFNQHDSSPYGSDKIGWVYVEIDLLDEDFERFNEEAKIGSPSEELLTKVKNYIRIMKEIPKDRSTFEYGLDLAVPDSPTFDTECCPPNAVVIIVFAKTGHD